jgi:hypothetical protein
MTPLAFSIELQTMSGLTSVLTHAARLGGQVTFLHAHAGQVQLRLLAPPQCAHRFGPQLEKIVEVIAVRELAAVEGTWRTLESNAPALFDRRPTTLAQTSTIWLNVSASSCPLRPRGA